MLRAAVFDLDGTLCPVGKPILPETVEGLKKLQESGVQIALSSGKPVYYLCGVVRQMGLENVILMGENGLSVQFGVDLPPAVHYQMPVAEHTRKALQMLKEKLAETFGDRIWLQPCQVEVTPFFAEESVHEELRAFIEREVREEEMGITLYDQCDCVDFCPTGVDKGSGLAYLCERMGWNLSEVAAVGDGVNDEPMLRVAGYSIGVGEKTVAGAKEMAKTIGEALKLLMQK